MIIKKDLPIEENVDLEIRLLLEGIFLKYGYDFRDYSKPHIKRRLLRRLTLSGISNISEMLYRVLNDRGFFERLLADLSINVTEMFRDPGFYLSLRKDVVPILRNYPFIKVWLAGCASGEEVYSVAILLQEEGIYDRCQIYATDFNEGVLDIAKEGIYPLDVIMAYASNYESSGGRAELSDYYIEAYNSVVFHQSLRDRVLFADHNLVTDGVFGEMHLIICRNVLIYFNKELQCRVLKLFFESLAHGGIMGLGSKESLKFTCVEDRYITINAKEKLYQKKFD